MKISRVFLIVISVLLCMTMISCNTNEFVEQTTNTTDTQAPAPQTPSTPEPTTPPEEEKQPTVSTPEPPKVELDYTKTGMPALFINGDISEISKENKVKVSVEYKSADMNFDCFATLKVQGSSSAKFPKKNYTIQFFENDEYDKKQKMELQDGWGEQSKYCLKANYVDFSQARNVVSAKLWGEVAHSSGTQNARIMSLVNAGAIDGYPIIVYHNNEFLGLYTMNIPKDAWMFGMEGDETTYEAIVGGDDWSDSTRFRELMADDFSNGWEVEYSSTEDVEGDNPNGWIVESFNHLLDFVITKDGEEFRNGLSQYLDVDLAIDLVIYTAAMGGHDNLGRNMLWATYDGVQWIPTVYDLDLTWGSCWTGHTWTLGFKDGTSTLYDQNLLFDKIIKNFETELKARYAELRGGILSEEHVLGAFDAFMSQIPDEVYAADKQKWPDNYTNDKDHVLHIELYTTYNFYKLDQYIKNLNASENSDVQ